MMKVKSVASILATYLILFVFRFRSRNAAVLEYHCISLTVCLGVLCFIERNIFLPCGFVVLGMATLVVPLCTSLSLFLVRQREPNSNRSNDRRSQDQRGMDGQ